jgi:hypothetical protein
MSDFVIVLVLVLLAALLAGVELVRSKAQDMNAWAILVLALAVLVDKL